MSSEQENNRQQIDSGRAVIGIELGSTRIKTVLIGEDYVPLATGNFDWENSCIDSIWTYSLDEVWQGLQASYRQLADRVREQYGTELRRVRSIGISAMMHGYLVFGRDGRLLAPFRTWRNNITGQAAGQLTELFDFAIPQRWCIAHLCQAILQNEPHVSDIDFMTTLSGYIHWQLSGRKVLGVGDASGYFPIDLATKDFDREMITRFDRLVEPRGFPWKLAAIMPQVLVAGEDAGALTEEGARLLDSSGRLQPGIPLCPPEGDAGTGMVATNSVAARTGNVSAGTSVFAMIVLEKALSRVYQEIDLVTTPDGQLVAMAHSNNCTSDYDAWISLFIEYGKAVGLEIPKARAYDVLLGLALQGDPDCGGLLAYGYISGEHMTGFTEGRPLFVRSPQSAFSLANFMRVHLFTSLGALRTGLNFLFEGEQVKVDEIRGHGGFFKTREVGQRIMAAATGVPVSVLETAGEGGAWGIALLAAYRAERAPDESLSEFLDKKVFAGKRGETVRPDPADVAGFNRFFQRYTAGLPIERAAVEHLV